MNKISAGGVIYKKEKSQIQILLIKDNWNEWTFAKGFVESGEEYQSTAIREMSEELGIDAKKLRFEKDLGEIEYDYFWEGEKIHKKVYYYLYKWVAHQEFHLQKEEGIQEAKWVMLGELKGVIGYKDNSLQLVNRIEKQLFGI